MKVQPAIGARSAGPACRHAIAPMAQRQPLRLRVEVVDRPVAPSDLAYAWEQMRHVGRYSPCAVQRGRTRLFVNGRGRPSATADAVLVFDGDLVICAGALAPTTREAIDQLGAGCAAG